MGGALTARFCLAGLTEADFRFGVRVPPGQFCPPLMRGADNPPTTQLWELTSELWELTSEL